MNKVTRGVSLSLLLLLALVGLQAHAQNGSKSLTLEQAIQYGLENSTEIQNNQLDQLIAKAQKNEIRGLGLPQVNAEFNYTDNIEVRTTFLPAAFFDQQAPADAPPIPVQFGVRYSTAATLSASQLLFSGDYIVALQAANTFLDLSEKGKVQTEIEVTAAISKSYYSILINEERYTLLESNVVRLEKIRNETQKLYDNGFAEKTDVDRLTVTYNNLKTETLNLRKMLDLSYSMLKLQIGMELEEEITLADDLDRTLVESLSTDISSFDFEDRVEIQLLNSQLELNEQDRKRYQMGYLPNIVAFGALGTLNQRNDFNYFQANNGEQWFNFSQFGLTLSWRLFDGGQREYKIQQARLNEMKTANTLKNSKKGIILEVENAQVSLENSLATMENQRMNMELSESILNTVSKKYTAGTASSLEVTQAEGDLKEAQTNYFNALYDAIVAKIDFNKALGQLTVQ